MLSINHKKIVNWNNTPNINNQLYNLKTQLETICGENVYGKNKNKNTIQIILSFSYSYILSLLSNYSKFFNIEDGIIINEYPSINNITNKLIHVTNTYQNHINNYLDNDKMYSIIIDTWAENSKILDGMPLNNSISYHNRILNQKNIRFIKKKISINNEIKKFVENSKGYISEPFIISYLNNNIKCPICKIHNSIAWCYNMTHTSKDSFRDAQCLNCKKNNIITLFEIKTRWESKNTPKEIDNCYHTNAGSFAALNNLMMYNANIFLIIVFRDSGSVKLGKISKALLKGNKDWLYNMQEKIPICSPSSTVICNKIYNLPNKMIPTLENILSNEIFEKICFNVLKNFT
jgi:hypothetical protein